MRAKFILAAALLLSACAPAYAQGLLMDVHQTLYPPAHHGLLGGLFGGLLGGGSALVTQSALVSTGCLEQPLVIAPTACGNAILSPAPLDLDIRREQLIRRINCLGGIGALSGCQTSELNSAMAQVNQAETCMRSKGDLTNWQARRLYKAMDEIGARTDRFSGYGPGLNGLIGLSGGMWY